MEGALVLIMKQKLKPFPNPWRRTYKNNQSAFWERNMSYCKTLVLNEMTRLEQDEVLYILNFDLIC